MSEVKIKLAAGTNVGLVRQNNEDNFVVSSDLSTSEWLIPQVGVRTGLGDEPFRSAEVTGYNEIIFVVLAD